MPRLLLHPAGLRALLARREQLLVAAERAAVEAALSDAGPELRAELLRLLGRSCLGGTFCTTPPRSPGRPSTP